MRSSVNIYEGQRAESAHLRDSKDATTGFHPQEAKLRQTSYCSARCCLRLFTRDSHRQLFPSCEDLCRCSRQRPTYLLPTYTNLPIRPIRRDGKRRPRQGRCGRSEDPQDPNHPHLAKREAARKMSVSYPILTPVMELIRYSLWGFDQSR